MHLRSGIEDTRRIQLAPHSSKIFTKKFATRSSFPYLVTEFGPTSRRLALTAYSTTTSTLLFLARMRTTQVCYGSAEHEIKHSKRKDTTVIQ
jgi:hypothetical protein